LAGGKCSFLGLLVNWRVEDRVTQLDLEGRLAANFGCRELFSEVKRKKKKKMEANCIPTSQPSVLAVVSWPANISLV